jgi:hypothetical protein
VHVEVFRMAGVGTSILGRPRHLSRDRRASPRYTLNCEEPRKSPRSTDSAVWLLRSATSSPQPAVTTSISTTSAIHFMLSSMR